MENFCVWPNVSIFLFDSYGAACLDATERAASNRTPE
jgi:hypothetical protein